MLYYYYQRRWSMKKMVLKISKGVLIGLTLFGLLLLLAYQQTHYVRIGHVVLDRVYGINNEYVFADSTGQKYSFITTEQISPYDTVKVKMFNNCTEEYIYDDMIIDYKIVFDSENKKEN